MKNEDKVALVTGSARRIGAVTVRRLHQKGYNVVVHYRQSEYDAAHLCAELNENRAGSAAALACDFDRPDTIAGFADQVVNQFGRIDLLVNNASAFYPTPVGSISLDQISSLLNSNFVAPLLLSQQLAPSLADNSGSIVNIVDIHAKRPYKGYSVYCSAKAALLMQTQSLALELAPDVRVNGIAPGSILWPEDDAALDEQAQEKVLEGIPMQRNGSPDDIANTVAWLAGDAAAYITGQIVSVDGGRSL